MKDAVIIISGGMDSTTMLYEYKDEIALAITFDYGSTQNGRERVCAITHCQRLGIKHIVVPLEFMHRYFKSALLGDPEDIPEGDYNDESMKSTVVPFRNHGDFHEDCVNIIMKDLVKLMNPKYLEVIGLFNPRGGISIKPFANYGDNEHQDMVRQRLLANFHNQ